MGREGWAESKGGKSPEMWHWKTGSKMTMPMGWARSWEESSPPGPRSPSWPLSSGVLRERPYIHTWVGLEAGVARPAVTVVASGQRSTRDVHFTANAGGLALSRQLDVSLEPSTALSLWPHRAE